MIFHPFPLTLTLSLREREQQSPVLIFSTLCMANPALCFANGRESVLPLLGGEGRGEGECSTNCFLSMSLLTSAATN